MCRGLAGVRLVLVLLQPLCLCSCVTAGGDPLHKLLRASEDCYTPLRERRSPTVASDGGSGEVPLVNRMPPGSRVLGTFKISADFQLILRALQYNARRVGADAVVVHSLQWWDIRNWEAAKTVDRTETIQPTEEEKKAYREKLKQFEEARQQGKPVERPSAPTVSHKHEQVFVPGFWEVSGNASLEASFVERNAPGR
jgi:hypothetical protein